MQASKLKVVTLVLILFSLFLGGFLGFCGAVSKNVHPAAYEAEYPASAVMGKSASGCCEIHAARNNYFKLFALSITENKNSGLGTALLAALALGALAAFFDAVKKYLAARIYYLRQAMIIFGNYLLRAFSQGLLNPKIYEL